MAKTEETITWSKIIEMVGGEAYKESVLSYIEEKIGESDLKIITLT
jgi:hypothetical protein